MLFTLIKVPSTYLIELHLEEMWKRIEDDCRSFTNKSSKEQITDFYKKKQKTTEVLKSLALTAVPRKKPT